MGKPKTRADFLQTKQPKNSSLFISRDAQGGLDILQQGRTVEAYQGVQRADASRDTFKDISTNISVRSEYTRGYYESFRPTEAIPQQPKDIIAYCMEAYRKIGIVRNVIDLMADFGSQGIKLNHPNSRIQTFYRKWFEKVNGPERSERFLNMLYRAGNVFIRRYMAKLGPLGTQKFTALGEKLKPDIDMPEQLQVALGSIPIRYNFYNPLAVETVGGEMGQFIGKSVFAIRLSYSLRRLINAPHNAMERQLVDKLPVNIKMAANKGDGLIFLDNDTLCVYYYKKDDWQEWADPMTFAILSELIMLEKMQLADLSALDGVISQIRVWKLGRINDAHPEASIFPSDTAIAKLADILLSNPGGGAFDLIWGPDIEVEEIKTDVHNFLGNTKYEPVLNSIYAGLGVPPTLTGTSSAPGMTNNYISLKTLVQRLEYGRSLLTLFWNQEINLVQQAMSFKLPATVEYDRMILADEAAEKALLIQLVDRNIVSAETVAQRVGENFMLERLRMKKEERERDKGELSQKAGPWNDPEKLYKYTMAALQRGFITPKDVGIESEHVFDAPPFINGLKGNPDLQDSKNNTKGVSGQGRPKLSKDSSKRTRTSKIRTSASLEDMSKFLVHFAWAKEAQTKISDIVVPIVLNKYNKKDLRSLSGSERESLDSLKFTLLMRTPLFANITSDIVYELTTTHDSSFAKYNMVYNKLVGKIRASRDSDLTLNELRDIQASVYSLMVEYKH